MTECTSEVERWTQDRQLRALAGHAQTVFAAGPPELHACRHRLPHISVAACVLWQAYMVMSCPSQAFKTQSAP